MSNVAKWRKFTRQEIDEFVQESYSYASLIKKLGYAVNSGNSIKAVKTMISELDLDVSHFKGKGWNRNNFNYNRFRKGVTIKASQATSALAFIRGHRCEGCGGEQWMGKPIPLETHHKDGDPLNNEMENLKLLCPNCHALTDNYRGRNINVGIKQISEESFADALNDSQNIRQALRKLGLSAKGDNYRRARDIIFKYNITHLMSEHQEEKFPE